MCIMAGNIESSSNVIPETKEATRCQKQQEQVIPIRTEGIRISHRLTYNKVALRVVYIDTSSRKPPR